MDLYTLRYSQSKQTRMNTEYLPLSKLLQIMRATGQAFLQRNRCYSVYLLSVLGVLIILDSWNPVSGTSITERFHGRLWLIIGTGLLYLAFIIQGKQGIAPRPLWFERFRHRAPMPYWILIFYSGPLFILLGFWANPTYHFVGWRPPVESWLPNYYQLALFLSAISLWILGFMRKGDPTRIIQRIGRSLKHDYREWVLVISLMAIALGVRIYRLDSSIPVMISDETAYLSAAQRILIGEEHLTIASDMHRGDLFLGAYFISIIIDNFGASLFTGRLLVTLVGALAIPGVYMMGRKIFNWQAGLLAAMFLITQPLHMHFSRIAMYDIYDPTFCIFAVLLIWDGMERGGYWKFALAGALIGVSLYFYAGAKLWVILLPAWFGLMALRQPRVMLSHWFNIVIIVVTVLLILFPIAAHFTVHNLSPLGHAQSMSRGTQTGGVLSMFEGWTAKSFVFDALSPSVRAFVDKGDITRHFEPIGKVAINLRWALLAFAIGIAYYLRHALNNGLLFLMLWIGGTVIFGGALMDATPGFSRYVTATLPMAIIAGVGISAFFYNFRELLPAKQQAFTVVPAVALLLVVNYHDLRYVYEALPRNWIENMGTQRLVNAAVIEDAYAMRQQGHKIYFMTNQRTDHFRLHEAYLYICPDCIYRELDSSWVKPSQINPDWVTEIWLLSLKIDREAYIYVFPHRNDPYDLTKPLSPQSRIHLILEAYPDAEITRFNSDVYNTERHFPLYTRVKIPADAVYCPPGAPCRNEP